MNNIQNRRARDLEKQFPGCMGRMINLFDLSAGMTGNRLLTEKAHRDGTVFPSIQADAAEVFYTNRDCREDKPIGYENRRTFPNKKSDGTPIKMLIAQEMSKEKESKHKPPSVIAKLMGLDALPEQQYDSVGQRIQPKGYSRINHPGMVMSHRHEENDFLDEQIQDRKEYKDVYEVWQQSPKTPYIRDKSPQKGSYNGSPDERKLAFVHKKFIEAKRLATDEKLRQSKEFHDAVEVLSSNKDLFLQFLQEPNSLLSQHLYELQSIPPPPQTRRITVLKPSKTREYDRFGGPEMKTEKQIKKHIHREAVEVNTWDKNMSGWSVYPNRQKPDTSAYPTRIVVLKPSPGKTHEIKALVSSPSLSPRLLHSKVPYGEAEDEVQGSREIAKEITRRMRESLSTHERNETMLASMLSNGYVGDESSFHRSEKGYIEEGNLSDSEVMTPTSRHSWDYINKSGSPFSSSPFSRTSYSPESSVSREAKKRLSERWAMMSSNGSCQEQRQVRRSSSTLGEMLSLCDTKKPIRSGEEGGEIDLREEKSCLSSSRNEEKCGDSSPRNLLRSRSVPVSSTTYETRLKAEVPNAEVDSFVPKEITRSNSGKSSFKGRVSSLFFSRNKKQSKEKSGVSLASPKDGSSSIIDKLSEIPDEPSAGKITEEIHRVTESFLRGVPLTNLSGSLNSTSTTSICAGSKEGTTQEEIPYLKKPETLDNPSENQDHPSPISVLEPPFEDEQSPGNNKSEAQGSFLHTHSLKSNLIDKSPPIESIARTLSWDDASSETATLNPLNLSMAPLKEEDEEQERLFYVQMLLSTSGLDSWEQSYSISSRWYSPESPLDPSLMDKYFFMKDDKKLSEATRRYRRSSRRLIFDCVNAALVEIMGCESSGRAHNRSLSGSPVCIDEVWVRVKEFFSSETKCFSDENGNNYRMLVERVVRKEAVGRGWSKLMKSELDGIGKEIEGKVLEELIDEVLFESTNGL